MFKILNVKIKERISLSSKKKRGLIMDEENTIVDFDFKTWIKEHDSDDYQVEVVSDETIKLKKEYGEAKINFIKIEESLIVEFKILSKKDDLEGKFTL